MKPERIKALIDLMADSDLSELSLTEGDTQLRLLREHSHVTAVSPATPAIPTTPVAAPPLASTEAAPAAGQDTCASLYGVLHLTPAPDQPPFVEVGSVVEVGDTLAVLEAMKMFHPIKSEVAGTVTAVLAASGDEVQAGQALIRIG